PLCPRLRVVGVVGIHPAPPGPARPQSKGSAPRVAHARGRVKPGQRCSRSRLRARMTRSIRSESSMTQYRKRRRVIPIIDARFQWKYTLLIVALGVGVSFVMGALLYRTYLENTRLLEIDPRFQEQVVMGDRIFLVYMVVGVVLMAVVLGI